MHKDLTSFFFFTSASLLLLFIFSSLLSYNYFNLSSHLNLQEKTQLFMVGLSVFFIILFILFLFAKKFLLPILDLKEIVVAQKEGTTSIENITYFDDEISYIAQYISDLKKELDEDNSELKDLSLRDPLTGINNRRYFVEFGETIFKLAKRNKEPLSLIMFDIDHLNSVNKKYGKKAGDNIVSLVSQSAEDHLRKSDIFARYAEDIFVILLPKTDETQARLVAQKIQDTLEAPSLKHKTDAYYTISIGLSTLLEKDLLLRSMTLRADDALLHAKENGRDSIFMNPSA
ncbi:MAG: hypothetical protein COA44_03710 [Arcobacter sp.]|nr:MAG: hypothetical protein COA44_03710 [Arcobacter sp.]